MSSHYFVCTNLNENAEETENRTVIFVLLVTTTANSPESGKHAADEVSRERPCFNPFLILFFKMKEGSPFSGRNYKCVQCFMIIPKVSTADESPTQKLFQAAYRTAKAKKHHEPYRLEWNKWNNTHTHTQQFSHSISQHLLKINLKVGKT